MHTEHLHQTLSPQAYAALLDGLQRQALQDRRRAVQAFGQVWSQSLWRWWQRSRYPVFPTQPQKA